jgi:hypothetical protein
MFSRFIVGYEVLETEKAEYADNLSGRQFYLKA